MEVNEIFKTFNITIKEIYRKISEYTFRKNMIYVHFLLAFRIMCTAGWYVYLDCLHIKIYI